MNILAFYYIEKGNPYLAYKYANESLAIFEKLGIEEKVCEVTMNIGVLLGREGKPDQALSQFEKAYQMSLQLKQDSIQPSIILNMAFPKSFHATLPELNQLYDKAHAIAAKNKDERVMLSIKQARTAMKFFKGMDVRQIIAEQHEVIRETQEKGYEYLTAMSYMEMGNMFLQLDVDSALHYYEAAIALAKNTGYDVLHYHTLTQAYEALKRQRPMPAKANEYGNILLEMSRQKQLDNQKEGISFLELAIKEKEVEIATAKHQLRRTWLMLLLAICVLAVAFIVAVYRQYRLKRKLAASLAITNKQLEEKNRLLETNNEFHQKLISMLSHDLRQPFSSILMMRGEGITEYMSKEDLLYVFDQIYQSANTGLQALDGLLHWMKLQVIGLAYSPSVVNLKNNIDEALAFNSGVIAKKQLEVMLFVPEMYEVKAQREMLLFVNRNIIHNAVKHAPEKGQLAITATLRDADHQITVCIADNGGGIPADVLPYLFQKDKPAGQQASESRGSGLALIICHEMVSTMDGDLWAANNDDAGASFYYSLPIALVDGHDADLPASATDGSVTQP